MLFPGSTLAVAAGPRASRNLAYSVCPHVYRARSSVRNYDPAKPFLSKSLDDPPHSVCGNSNDDPSEPSVDIQKALREDDMEAFAVAPLTWSRGTLVRSLLEYFFLRPFPEPPHVGSGLLLTPTDTFPLTLKGPPVDNSLYGHNLCASISHAFSGQYEDISFRPRSPLQDNGSGAVGLCWMIGPSCLDLVRSSEWNTPKD
ncbi:hypothetical protein EV401DRAFT_1993381 [Pisolithus croceorrhizus]|nr:hypothetical protein EV401DRAFT_1993381 [Pisolithus croceorrhizus]